jgi:NAD(P)-dependent dehydrogenase (short-subunit alcohol dehydrogenase family)
MSTPLAGKVVLVTGATSGMGRVAARRLAADGAAVVAAGRDTAAGESLAAGIGGLFVRTDVTVEDDVARLVDTAVRRYGRLDGAFNNAGGVAATGPVDALSADDWQADLALNLTGVFHCLKYEAPAIAASGGGAVVNNASIGGVRGIPGMASYVAAKHGVVGLTKSVALEWADRKVRVNALVTGNVDTPLYRRLVGMGPDDPGDLPAPNPSKRVAAAEEIAGFVAYLLRDEAAFITGAELAIDGGDTAS